MKQLHTWKLIRENIDYDIMMNDRKLIMKSKKKEPARFYVLKSYPTEIGTAYKAYDGTRNELCIML